MWSLTKSEIISYIKGPKLVPPKGIDFSQNGLFMCLAERRDCKDWISIYYAGHDFKLTNAFEVSETWDLADCKWIMKSAAILVQDNPIESKFVIYSAMTGRAIAVHTP